MFAMPREPFNYRLALLVLLTAGSVWVGFYSREAKGQDADYFITMAIAVPAGVWLFGFLVWVGHMLVSSYILRDTAEGVVEFNKVLAIVCAAAIVLSLFKISGDAKTTTTKYTVQTPAGEVVECIASEYHPSTPDDDGY